MNHEHLRPALRPLHAGIATLLLLLAALAGCAHHHDRMMARVDWLLEAHQHRQALDYLERYLGRHPEDLDAWRHRVAIRLELDQRAAAAAEYWRLRTALGQPHHEVLHQVVLGGNGDWIVSDYPPLARCASDDVMVLDDFAAILEGFTASEAAPVFVAPRRETVIGVMNAMPGRYGVDALPVIEQVLGDPTPEVRLAAVEAAIRLAHEDPAAAQPLLQAAVEDRSAKVRRGTLVRLLAPTSAGDLTTLRPAAGESDVGVALAWLALSERLEGAQGDALRADLVARFPLCAALAPPPPPVDCEDAVEVTPVAQIPADDPLLALAVDVGSGSCDAECWNAASFPIRRTLLELTVPVWPLEPGVMALAAADPDMVVRSSVAGYLIHGTGDGSLLPLLQDEDQGVHQAAARALTLSGDATAAEPLTDFIGGAGLEEKLSVLDAMTHLPDNVFLPLATQLMEDETALVREAAVPVVAAACGEDAEEVFVARLTDDDPHVVVRSAAALYVSVVGKEEEGEDEQAEESADEG